MTDLKDIQRIQAEFIKSRKWDRFTGTQVFTHLIEELGEIASHLLYSEKYKIIGAGHEGIINSLEMEFGQAFNLFLHLAILAGVDLNKAWNDELSLLEERFPSDVWSDLAGKSEK
ncbi:MAG: hypothetical protein ACXAD7_00900 [Candidatus Kariarchaeaceae archaeon]|jgi:NTP pyrophosphatase (non-canonical NTP hydrolase)